MGRVGHVGQLSRLHRVLVHLPTAGAVLSAKVPARFEQGQISTVSAKTAAKMFTGRAVDAALVPGTAAGAAAGIAADKLDLNPPAAPSPPPSQEPIFYAP